MQNKRVYKISEAISRIKNYCAMQDRCQWDVRQKLTEWGLLENTKDIIMTELINDGFIDEERFSRSFCRGKFRIKKWGRRKIKFELKMKNISSVCIKKGMEEIDEKEYLKALENQVEKKNGLIKEKNHFKRQTKLGNYLIKRGFESNLVWEKLKEMSDK
ncbi:MAG: regulatory protein RecX [Flavobacteriales bacterium]|nr:regulatory protein RecX [Flavobacteriales bacterium]MDP7430672.1 regulatory protein RecX [Flavobacteriales bacterium]HJN63985.1 regulatory protein RecX [Flavobacteriales bacterium]